MLAVVVFAVLIPSAMPKGWLPVGCVARYGNPVAEIGPTWPFISPDGKYLIGNGRVYDTATGKNYRLWLENWPDLRIESDHLTTAGFFVCRESWNSELRPSWRVGGSADWQIALLDYATGKSKRVYNGPPGDRTSLWKLHVSLDGQTVAAYWNQFNETVWTIFTPNGPRAGVSVKCFLQDSRQSALSVDGKRLAVISSDLGFHLDVYDSETGKRLLRAPLSERSPHTEARPVFSPDGNKIALHVYGKGVFLFDLIKGQHWKALVWDWWYLPLHFSADGKTLFGDTFRSKRRQWNVTDGTEGKATKVPESPAGLWSADRSAYLERIDDTLRVIDAKTKKARLELPLRNPISRFRVTNESAELLYESGGGFFLEIREWAWAAGTVRKRQGAHDDWERWEQHVARPVERFEFDYEGEKPRVRDRVKKTVYPLRYSEDDDDHVNGVSAQILGPTGLVAAWGLARKEVFVTDTDFIVFDPKTGRRIASYTPPAQLDISECWFHPNGREVWIAVTDEIRKPEQFGFGWRREHVEGRLVVLDLATGTTRRTTLFPHAVRQFRSDGKGRLMALSHATEDGGEECCVLDTTTGKPVLNHAKGSVVLLTPDGRWLLTSERNLYDLRHPENEPFHIPARISTVLPAPDEPGQNLFTPDGKRLVTALADGCVYVWDMEQIAGIIARNPKRRNELVGAAWRQLHSANGEVAEQALAELLQFPAESVSLVKDFPVVRPVSEKDIRRALADIKADDGGAWMAFDRLIKWSEEGSRDSILAALKAAKPEDIEVLGENGKEFIRGLEWADQADPLSPERLRFIRAVELMERLGTPEAKAVLKTWAGGAPNARLTTEAKAALERLGK